jgi:DNA-binding NarL/FixJ family response regulator
MTLSPTVRKKQILIVEDHPLFRAMLVRLIEQDLGMTVCGQAGNLSDALNLIGKTRPDAAIVDLTLSGPGGLELLKELKARGIQLPVLVLSMHDEKLYAARALRAGAKGYISKEQSPAEVAAAIRTVVEGGIYASGEITKEILKRQTSGDQPPPAQEMDALSDRELEVFQLIGEGFASCEISERLHLGTTTVDSYRARIKQKLALKNAAELYQRAALWVAAPGA